MKKYSIGSLCLLVTFLLQGQFIDNFSDANFDQNPSWQGNMNDFVVNANLELQLNAASGGVSSLFVPVSTADSTVWEFFFRLEFAPSTSNQLRVYLQTDNDNFAQPLNGYFLMIGATGSSDAIELYKQSGGNSILLASGTVGAVANDPALARVRVVRDNAGNWELWADYTGGTNFQLEASAMDDTHQIGQFFGIECRYTSTRKDKFFLDDFFINPLFIDTEPPVFQSITIINPNELDLTFNEQVTLATAQNLSNYSTPNLSVVSATLQNDQKTVRLALGQALEDGQTYSVVAINIADVNGNVALSQTLSFTYFAPVIAQPFDVLINEILADPTPSIGMPEVEFLELYNRSEKAMDLENFELKSGNTSALFPQIILPPKSYAIVCDITDTAAFTSFGKVIGLGNFPNLSNNGDELLLYNAFGNLIHSVFYNINWYGSNGKNEGGWTLERVNEYQLCEEENNWAASQHLSGGTPGQQNSIATFNLDETPPDLIWAFPVSPTTIRLFFSEKLDLIISETLTNYTLVPMINLVDAFLEFPEQNTVLLTLEEPLDMTQVYEITVYNAADCMGNLGRNFTTKIGLPATIEPNDIVINEILFNPKVGGSDFIELYNRSGKILNTNDLMIGNAPNGIVENLKNIQTERLFFPQDYLVITENPFDIKERYNVLNEHNLLRNDLPTFPDEAGSAVLVAGSKIIDQFDYQSDYHFPLIEDKNGVSLERIDPERPTQNPDNWHSAASTVGFATPTFQNSQFLNIEKGRDFLTLSSLTVSPDSDGYEDVLLLDYQLDKAGFFGVISIYNAAGIKVKTLSNNELLATSGTLQWDGVKENGMLAEIGVYIVEAKLLHPEGEQLQIKKTFAVVTRF